MDFSEPASESLLEQGLQVLRDLLGDTWEITLDVSEQAVMKERSRDALVQVRSAGDGVFTQLLVNLEEDVTPRVIEEQLLPKLDLVRRVNRYTTPLVITPWISQRIQLLLRENEIGYIDLTGNAFLRVARPAIAIYTQGDSRPPRSSPTRASRTTLAGPKAGRLVRLLTDIAPPYRAGELAEAADLSLPYVSRLLGVLEDQLLIRRQGRVVADVDWPQLLRARAEQYVLLRQGSYVGMVAPNGIDAVLEALRALPARGGERILLTGSYAARTVAPLAVGGQLMLYLPSDASNVPDELGDELGLLPVRKGADVLLLRAEDKVVQERATRDDGIGRVALSQLVLDCIAGPGRLPAEGEAVLKYMQENPGLWRKAGLRE
ncbi:hypothetical protein [Kribbella sp. CA-293567]|uniref:hypothetical protein n=1 Tax=Kribbella sp. CA-293567 TaxID=3002436 RepID=UPI0022DDE79C|nr:hypothetical protein [Kribbella sp. CA-293567]WBQ04650.1 hypothetical protein OX958_32390 [Kribbella sp. CA-293567]